MVSVDAFKPTVVATTLNEEAAVETLSRTGITVGANMVDDTEKDNQEWVRIIDADRDSYIPTSTIASIDPETAEKLNQVQVEQCRIQMLTLERPEDSESVNATTMEEFVGLPGVDETDAVPIDDPVAQLAGELTM